MEERADSRPCLVDTHAHLCDAVFDQDRQEVLDRAREAGVGAVIAVGEDLPDAEKNLALAESHPAMVRLAAGLFPTILDLAQANALLSWIRQQRQSLVALGEVGLDYWKVKEEADRELQRVIFGRFIDLAQELDLPVNVHSRAAGRHVVGFLLERGAQKVQLHAFDGRAAVAMPAVEAGYFFSVPPSVVRSRQKQKLVRRLPLSSLLLETDSPVLGPTAEERNEPANVVVALQAIADLKGIHPQQVIEAVADNTRRLYGDLLG